MAQNSFICRSMLRLRRAVRGSRTLIALTEFSSKERESEGVALEGEFRIVARAFVAEEGVGAVEFVPGKVCAGGVESCLDFSAAFERDVRILPAPNHQKLALNFRNPIERVVIHTS